MKDYKIHHLILSCNVLQEKNLPIYEACFLGQPSQICWGIPHEVFSYRTESICFHIQCYHMQNLQTRTVNHYEITLHWWLGFMFPLDSSIVLNAFIYKCNTKLGLNRTYLFLIHVSFQNWVRLFCKIELDCHFNPEQVI